ncbi:MAG: sugar phosphate nucleotidyltransferase [Candidatus Latescibacteria bacterium]|jgi:mannose-1-phosphate guanylyltransferase|nr:sugar phosphate nucleotidyltransferase [Candidatus Latescibacterota bacterium]
MKIVIRAGGVGTRLWPYSRKRRPKQFHSLVGSRTMVQEAVDRVVPLVNEDDLYVSTGADLVGLVQEQLPTLAADRLIVEPALRNTGPAVGLECALLEARFPGCTVASLGSDHHIGRPEEFRRLLSVAEAALEEMPDTLFTIGVKPTRVETGYGYIQKGARLCAVEGEPVHAVSAFTEKPDADRARAYVDSGDYLWNSNMFVWKASTMLELFRRFEPEIHRTLEQIAEAVGTPREAGVILEEYPKMPEVAIDNAILERAESVATLEADIHWSDIGSWGALTDVLATDDQGNLLSGDILAVDTRNVTAYGPEGKLIALVDVEDLVVVDTGDALLVCPREGSQRVKDLVERLTDDPGRARLI